MAILFHPDPALRRKARKVTVFDEKLKELSEQMFEIMRKHEGIGLAATQVGHSERIAVVELAGEQGDDSVTSFVMVNPEVAVLDPELVGYEEGCLSVPGVRAEVLRPRRIRLNARSVSGEEFSLDAESTLAVCIQHELDHLNGLLFFDRLSQPKKEKLLAEYLAA